MSFDKFTLASVVAENARSRPNTMALVDGDRRVTYRELGQTVERLAQGLASRGLAPGDRLLWLGQNSGSVIELLVACARMGMVFCAINWRQSPEEMAWTIRDYKPSLIICQDCEISDQFDAARALLGDDISAEWLPTDQDGGVSALSASAPAELPEPTLDMGVYALYTAAFDGRPQAAVLSNMSILYQNLILGRDQSVDEGSVFLNSGPMFHMGTMMTTFAVLHQGGTNVIIRRAAAADILDLIETEKCTHAFLMPPTLLEMESEQAAKPRNLSSLWPAGKVERPAGILTMPETAPLFGKAGLYGQSETGGLIATTARGGGGAGKSVLAEIRFVDDADREVLDGEIGEIVVRSPLLMNGYLDRDEENASRRRGGWHHTGDLGRRRPDGAIEFVGPKTVIIKSAAENVYPTEVEMCLRQHPAVADVCVIGIPDAKWGQSVKAVIECKEGLEASETELIEHCRQRIASYKKPRFVSFIAKLPRVAGGAVDRQAVDAEHGGGGYPQSR